MPVRDDFEDDAGLDDDEGDDGGYDAEDASVDTLPCPYCGKPVYEQAELCPHCRSYISREEGTGGRRWPWWVWAGIGLALLGSLPWLFFH